jgi:predicted dehydrogenase
MAALKEIRLAAACDVDEARAKETAEAAGDDARVFTSVETLLTQADIPAVIVATPNFTHREIVLAALAAGKDVFCEKPMALTVADCDEMIATARQHGRKLMVGQVLRLITVFATVRRLIDEGLIGQPRAIRILRAGARSAGRAGRSRASWRMQRANTGGLLFEVNVHEFDFMRAVMGEAAEVSGTIENFFHPEQDYEDHAIVTVRFQNGGVGVLEASTAHAIGTTEGIITGEKGSILYNWGKNTVAYRLADAGNELIDVPVERDAGRSVQSELASFARWVLHDDAPVVTADDGRRAVQLAEAAYRSAREKRSVTIE